MRISFKDPFSGVKHDVLTHKKGALFFFVDQKRKKSTILSVLEGTEPVVWEGTAEKGFELVRDKEVKMMSVV